MGQLESLVTDMAVIFYCIVVTETWCSKDTILWQFAIDGYYMFSSAMSVKSGGGVAVYVRDSLQAVVLDVHLEGVDSLLVCISESGEICARSWPSIMLPMIVCLPYGRLWRGFCNPSLIVSFYFWPWHWLEFL